MLRISYNEPIRNFLQWIGSVKNSLQCLRSRIGSTREFFTMDGNWIPAGAARGIPAKERGNRGIFPSTKVPGGILEYESCLERDFFVLCQHAPDVEQFQHQPVSISYVDGGGRTRKYTPDAYVKFSAAGRRALFEIKYEGEVLERRDHYEERWTAAENWARARNMTFAVVTEEQIRTPRWFNAWFTLGASKCRSVDTIVGKLLPLVPEQGERYDALCACFSQAEGIEITKAAQVLCYAIYHGLVFLDSFSTKTISNASVIRRKRPGIAPTFKSFWEELGLVVTPPPGEFTTKGDVKRSKTPENLIRSLSFRVPRRYEEKVRHRTQIVEKWLGRPRQERSKEWREKFCARWRVSEKTVYNWVNAYKFEGLEGLVPRHRSAGRRPRVNAVELELVEQCRQYFLKPLTTQKKAFAKLETLCRDHGVNPPSMSSFLHYVYSNSTAADFATKRGRRYHKAHFTPSLASYQGAVAPMQVVQMDNTSFDVFPVDSEEREGLPTPHMTAAMDCYTRTITGFSVSFFPASAHSVLEVLVQTILPKESYVRAYNTEQGWPIQGFPVLLLVDNGMDYRSRALREFGLKYDVIVEYAPVRTPRYKAFIEQWFHVLHNALVMEDVPGFRPLLKHRLENPDLEPEREAVLTLQELEEWLHKWVLDEYHFTNPYDDHAPAPYLRWRDFQDGRTGVLLPLPREPPEDSREVAMLHLSTLERVERVLSYEGIKWHHLKYNSEELAELYGVVGKQKVEVLINPRDVRSVWVVDPRAPGTIPAGLASGWAQVIAKIHGNRPIHASAWRTEVRLLRGRLKRRLSPYSYQVGISRLRRQELLDEARKTTKTVRKKREQARESARKAKKSRLPENRKPSPARVPPVQTTKKEIDWSKIKPAGRRKMNPY